MLDVGWATVRQIAIYEGCGIMYIMATISTLIAWVVGLLLDANIDFSPQGFLCFRLLLPILAMGLCILHSIKENKDKRD